MRFADILKGLIEESGLTRQQIANDLEMPRSTLGGYTLSHEPDIETLKKLADYFDCSVDYLVGYKSKHTNSLMEEDMLRVFRLLSNEQQKLLIEIGKTISKSDV